MSLPPVVKYKRSPADSSRRLPEEDRGNLPPWGVKRAPPLACSKGRALGVLSLVLSFHEKESMKRSLYFYEVRRVSKHRQYLISGNVILLFIYKNKDIKIIRI